MQITFANIVIAREFSDGGTDSVTGFKPKAKSKTQPGGFLRAPYDTVFPRGNRLTTLVGIVRPASGPTLAQAMLALETLYGSLPDQGDLVKTVGGASVTYAGAVLESFEAVDDLNGVSYGFQLTFLAGKPGVTQTPVASPGVIGAESGAVLETESGAEIGTET